MNQQTSPKLPNGWTATFLSEIAETASGGTPSRRRKDFFGGSIPWLKSGELNDATLNTTEEFLTELGLESSSAKMFPEGTLCIALYGATVGKLAILGSAAATNQAVCGIFVHPLVNTHYLFYFLLGQRRNLIELGKGGAQPNISQEIIRRAVIPLPPLREQLRIVSKIDELMTKLDAGVEELRNAQMQLKRYRQAVLKAAVTGELTREWREAHKDELVPATKLLERIVEERRLKWEADQLVEMQSKSVIPRTDNWKKRYPEPRPKQHDNMDLPAEWARTDIDHVCVVVRGASPRPAGSPKYFGGDIPWITVGSLTADKKPFLTSVSEFVTRAGCEASRYIKPDTLLLTNSGATLGVPKITTIGGCINDGSVALLYADYPLKLYLYYCLSEMTKRLRQINQGAAQPNLNTSIVKAIAIPLPPVAEQHKIVSELERILSLIESVEQTINHGFKQAERIRQSILKQAFEGKLVPQDPNDEPAERLLERIKTERAKREAEKQAEAKSNRKRFTKSPTKRTERPAA